MSACPPCDRKERQTAARPAGAHAAAVRSAAVRAGALALCCLLAASCGFRKSRMRAEQAVGEFHDLLDKAQYEAIYDQADDSLKSSLTKADFVDYLRGIRSRLGAVKRSSTRGFQMSTVAGKGTEVALEIETEFDRGVAAEHFLWRITGDRAALCEYSATVERSTAPPSVRLGVPGEMPLA